MRANLRATKNPNALRKTVTAQQAAQTPGGRATLVKDKELKATKSKGNLGSAEKGEGKEETEGENGEETEAPKKKIKKKLFIRLTDEEYRLLQKLKEKKNRK